MLTIAVILLAGGAGWWLFHTLHQEINPLIAASRTLPEDLPGQAVPLAANSERVGAGLNEVLHDIAAARYCLAGGVCLCLLLALGLYFYLTAAIVKPLQTAAGLMSRLASGNSDENVPAKQLSRDDEIGVLAHAIHDLTAYQRDEVRFAADISSGNFTGSMVVRGPEDQLGLALRKLTLNAKASLARLNRQVEEVQDGCETIVLTGGELATTGDSADKMVAEISTGIGLIKNHADRNVEIVEQAEKLSGTSRKSIDRGYEDIGEMGEVMLNMQSCGDKIVGIAKFIGDIAFQTNLLALNARVEAARAGQHGKGFTIVADEVRNLSDRSSQAAKETSTLMKETVEQVELAAAIAGRINATFVDIQSNIQETDELIAKIAAASREQSDGIDNITFALRQVEKSTRATLNQVGEVTGKASDLVRQMERLRQAMRHMKVDYVDSPIMKTEPGLPPPRPLLPGGNEDAMRKAVRLPILQRENAD